MPERLTNREVDALCIALAQVLAGPLDGYDDDEAAPILDAMRSAHRKLWARAYGD